MFKNIFTARKHATRQTELEPEQAFVRTFTAKGKTWLTFRTRQGYRTLKLN